MWQPCIIYLYMYTHIHIHIHIHIHTRRHTVAGPDIGPDICEMHATLQILFEAITCISSSTRQGR